MKKIKYLDIFEFWLFFVTFEILLASALAGVGIDNPECYITCFWVSSTLSLGVVKMK